MRQRKVKNLETKYGYYEDILIREPSAVKGSWAGRADGRPVYVEIGCGKGKFISELAAREPDHFFVAIEGNMSVMLRAMEKIREADLDNVVFTPEYAEDLSDWFAPSEVLGIYLNFSDPLPKNYWYRRRLTYRNRLQSYFRVLAEDGTVTFKTDNTGLFEWTLLEIQAADLSVLSITRDLHAQVLSIEDSAERASFNIETEYEAKFSGLGEKIKRVVIGRSGRKDHIDMNKSIAAYNGRNIPEDISGDVRKALLPEKQAISCAVKDLPFASEPKSFTEMILTPGNTESVRMMISNYSCPSDRILIPADHRPQYDLIAEDMNRSVECFDLKNDNGEFTTEDFEYRVSKLLRNQEHLLIILDPDEYAAFCGGLPAETMSELCRVLNQTDLNKKIAFLTVMSGGTAEDHPGVCGLEAADNLRSNVLPVIAADMKESTGTGKMHSFAMCLAHNPETAEEFMRVSAFTAAASWTID